MVEFTSKQGASLALWKTYKAQLTVLRDEVERARGDGKTVDARLKVLLGSDERREEWNDLYEAEKRLLRLMPDSYLPAEAARRFAEAEGLGLPVAAPLKVAYEAANATADQKRAVLVTLLDEVHFRHTRRRLNRSFRKIAGNRLNYMGAVLLGSLVLLLLALILVPSAATRAHEFHILLVMYFGLLGAYLSRTIAFQSGVGTLDYDVVDRDFSYWSLIVRLITGMLGALTVYLLIIGGLLGGELFPSENFADYWQDKPDDAGRLASAPTANFAKLLIWSIIAGFSERLVPDQLTRLEASTRDQNPPAAT